MTGKEPWVAITKHLTAGGALSDVLDLLGSTLEPGSDEWVFFQLVVASTQPAERTRALQLIAMWREPEGDPFAATGEMVLPLLVSHVDRPAYSRWTTWRNASLDDASTASASARLSILSAVDPLVAADLGLRLQAAGDRSAVVATATSAALERLGVAHIQPDAESLTETFLDLVVQTRWLEASRRFPCAATPSFVEKVNGAGEAYWRLTKTASGSGWIAQNGGSWDGRLLGATDELFLQSVIEALPFHQWLQERSRQTRERLGGAARLQSTLRHWLAGLGDRITPPGLRDDITRRVWIDISSELFAFPVAALPGAVGSDAPLGACHDLIHLIDHTATTSDPESKEFRLIEPAEPTVAGQQLASELHQSTERLTAGQLRHELETATSTIVICAHGSSTEAIFDTQTSARFHARGLLCSDRELRPGELADANIRHGVILAACGASGSPDSSGHWAGLGPALIRAGAPWVIASSWPLPDTSATADFVARIVRHLRTGELPESALRLARFEMWRSATDTWAPWVCLRGRADQLFDIHRS